MRAAYAIGASAGGYVHGTGGTVKWWDNYDRAKAHFDMHGNLESFSESLWMSETRKSWKLVSLSEDQIHFLKALNFDFSPQSRAPRSKMGSDLSEALDLKEKFNVVGVGALSAEERSELLRVMRRYRDSYCQGRGISERNAQLLGVDYDSDYDGVIAALK